MDQALIKQGLELFHSQGILFWGATAAIAAGVTILVVALLLFTKKRIQNHQREKSGKIKKHPMGKSGKQQADSSLPLEFHPEIKNRSGHLISAESDSVDEALLVRLKDTVSRLESLQRAIGKENAVLMESPLKPSPPAVEYVYRQGIG